MEISGKNAGAAALGVVLAGVAWRFQDGLTQPTLQLRPIDVLAALVAVVGLTAFLCLRAVTRAPAPPSGRRPYEYPRSGVFDRIVWVIGCVVEDVAIRILDSARIRRAVVSASCAILRSPEFRDQFQEFLESEHVKESCARVVQDISEHPDVAQSINVGALNTGMIAALGVARSVPLVGRFVPGAADRNASPERPTPRPTPRLALPPSPTGATSRRQVFRDVPKSPRTRRSRSADARDRGFSSLTESTQASSEASSSAD